QLPTGRGFPRSKPKLAVTARLRIPKRRAVHVSDGPAKVGCARLRRARIERIEEAKLASRVASLVLDDKEVELAHVTVGIELQSPTRGCIRSLHQAGVHRGDEDEAHLERRIDIRRVDRPLPTLGGAHWR